MRLSRIFLTISFLSAFIMVCGCGDKEYHEAKKIVLVSSDISEETKPVARTTFVTSRNDNEKDSNATIDDSTTVYYTKTGKRYHLLESCTGKEMLSCTLGEAIKKGLTPCQKCAVE